MSNFFSSVAQSCLTLRPHGLQYTRLPCLSLMARVYSDSCPLSQWGHPTIMSPNYLMPYCPLLLLPSIILSIRVFSNESVHYIRWPKYWSFSFSIISSKGHLGLISFKVDWFDLLVAQGTLTSLLQHHSSKHWFFSFLYRPALTSIHDYWKNQSFD